MRTMDGVKEQRVETLKSKEPVKTLTGGCCLDNDSFFQSYAFNEQNGNDIDHTAAHIIH